MLPNHGDETCGSFPIQLDCIEREDSDKNWETARLLAAPDDASIEISQLPSIPPQRTNTAYLDGLRGLAAFCVFIHHFLGGFTGAVGHGFGEGGNYHFASFPFIRILWSGGDAGVACFFVLSGYVLSVGPLRKLKQKKIKDVRKGLVGALIRRPIRLYMPPLAVSLIVALLLRVPGLMLDDPFSKPRPSFGAQLYDWFWSSYHYFSIFREHVPGGYFYDNVVWTLPIELKGSLLVYGIVAVLSIGVGDVDHKVPLMMAVLLFSAAAVMLQMCWKLSMAEFILGTVVAITDVWSLGTHLTPRFMDVSNLLERVHLSSEVSRLMHKSFKVASVGTTRLTRRAAALTARIIPRPLLARLPLSSPRARPVPAELQTSTFFTNLRFFIGWYLLSQPAIPGHRQISANTPGWGWLTSMIPSAYQGHTYFRYWQAWGALLLITSLLRLSWAQRFFHSRPLMFLGRISFMLYLIHFPYFRLLPGRLISLFGGGTNTVVKGTFWDHTFAIEDRGPPGLSLRFLLCLSITLPTILVLAHVATEMIDEPSVKLGRWLTESIGLDKRRPKVQNNEMMSLPM